jgi:hypothetical protein
MQKFLSISVLLFVATNSFAADTILCVKAYPQWNDYIDNKLTAYMKGPAAIVDSDNNVVTWVGTGGSIYLTGEKNESGIKVIKVSGSNPTEEEILSHQQIGQTLDLQLKDSLGGIGLFRVTMMNNTMDNKDQSGSASWQHAADASSNEQLVFCTTNILK